MRKVQILGSGSYLPQRRVTAAELAAKMEVGVEAVRKIGMRSRYYAGAGETASYMGAQAAMRAIGDAGLALDDIDLVVCASGTMEMPIPCTAALIHNRLALPPAVPAFDINATCLSFLTALDTLSHLPVARSYRHILIVSAEIASVGLNYKNIESATLFGDGAAAVVLGPAAGASSSRIMAALMNTYSDGWRHCRIAGGGTGYPPDHWVPGDDAMFRFQMNGREVFRLALQALPSFTQRLLAQARLTMEEVDVVIPHQASLSAMNILERKLGIAAGRMVNIVEDYGNMIAASIPFALDHAIKAGRLARGQRLLLLGTSAGVSLGGMLLEY